MSLWWIASNCRLTELLIEREIRWKGGKEGVEQKEEYGREDTRIDGEVRKGDGRSR